MNSKRLLTILALTLLGIQSAPASDMSGALRLVPIAGAVTGLIIGVIVCLLVFLKWRRWWIWLGVPVFALMGAVFLSARTEVKMESYQDKILAVCGNYNHNNSGFVIGQVPPDFSGQDLNGFYAIVTNKANPVLSTHDYGVALVHQGNGLNQVYLNAYPDLEVPGEYKKVFEEMRRLMTDYLAKRSSK